MAEFDNDELLTDIRDRGSLPSADLRFTDTKLLAAATIELRDAIAPLLVEVQAERGVYLYTTSVTAGEAEYRLPSRALAARFKSVAWKGTGDTNYTRLRHESADSYYLQSDSNQGTPQGFFLRDNKLVLLPTPSAAGTLVVPYYLRPAKLVAPSATVASVSASNISSTAALFQFAGTPPTGLDTEGVITVDVVRATPGFESLALAAACQVEETSPGAWEYTVAMTETVDTGDYVCLPGQAPVPQCPVEVRGLLAARAARRALKSVGEAEQAAMLDADVQELESIARSLLAPRADSEPQEWGDLRRGLFYGLL